MRFPFPICLLLVHSNFCTLAKHISHSLTHVIWRIQENCSSSICLSLAMTSLFLPYWLIVIILEGLIVQHRKGVCEVDTAKQKEVKRLKETKRLCMYVYRYVYVCACMRDQEKSESVTSKVNIEHCGLVQAFFISINCYNQPQGITISFPFYNL